MTLLKASVLRNTSKQLLLMITEDFDDYRSSRLEVFFKKRVLKDFAKFTRKHVYRSLLFNKIAGFFNKVAACNFFKKETLAHVFFC